jgi:hypothetical protein
MEFVLFLAENKKTTTPLLKANAAKHEDTKSFLGIFFSCFRDKFAFLVLACAGWVWLNLFRVFGKPIVAFFGTRQASVWAKGQGGQVEEIRARP